MSHTDTVDSLTGLTFLGGGQSREQRKERQFPTDACCGDGQAGKWHQGVSKGCAAGTQEDGSARTRGRRAQSGRKRLQQKPRDRSGPAALKGTGAPPRLLRLHLPAFLALSKVLKE